MGWREGAGELDGRMLKCSLSSGAVGKLGAWLGTGDGGRGTGDGGRGTGSVRGRDRRARRSLHPRVLGRYPAVALGAGRSGRTEAKGAEQGAGAGGGPDRDGNVELDRDARRRLCLGQGDNGYGAYRVPATAEAARSGFGPVLPARLRPLDRPRLWMELAFTAPGYWAYTPHP